ncbi:MAG: ankyrin repeat domain-containing protein [Blautia sp.]|nr:ankyrin repeat domain-containing protein [Blautia sp.]
MEIIINDVDVMTLPSEKALETLLKEIERLQFYNIRNGEEDDRAENMKKMFRGMIAKADLDDDDETKYIFEALPKLLNFSSHFDSDDTDSDKMLELLDVMAESDIDFTEARYYRGNRTNFRDHLIEQVFDKYSLIEKLSRMGLDLDEALVNGKTPAHILMSRNRMNSFFQGGKEEQELARTMDFFSVESMEALDRDGSSAIHTAVKNNHFESLEAMIKKGIDVNITEDQPAVGGTTPLHTACAYGFPKIVQMLMDAGADDTMKNVEEETPAHVAVSEKIRFKKITVEERAEMIKALKNIDIPGKGGQTPLMLAQDYHLFISNVLTPLLIEKGADVNRKDNNGNTAILLYAQWQCHMSVVKPMVKAGLDLNARNKAGNTILHLALKNKSCEEARYLIKKGADYNIANEQQVTPMQIAVEEGLEDVLELMV